mgnify:CR=1 FL=1
MRIANTVSDSIVDGPGLRFTVFTQGCPHRCPGCHNPEAQAFGKGKSPAATTRAPTIRPGGGRSRWRSWRRSCPAIR